MELCKKKSHLLVVTVAREVFLQTKKKSQQNLHKRVLVYQSSTNAVDVASSLVKEAPNLINANEKDFLELSRLKKKRQRDQMMISQSTVEAYETLSQGRSEEALSKLPYGGESIKDEINQDTPTILQTGLRNRQLVTLDFPVENVPLDIFLREEQQQILGKGIFVRSSSLYDDQLMTVNGISVENMWALRIQR